MPIISRVTLEYASLTVRKRVSLRLASGGPASVYAAGVTGDKLTFDQASVLSNGPIKISTQVVGLVTEGMEVALDVRGSK
jgi:hypothetical protein